MMPKKLAVFSSACFLAVNRSIYERMAADGWTVRIFVPDWSAPPPPDPASPDMPVTSLARCGAGSRFSFLRGASRHLDDFMPDLVLLDLEPDSLAACQLARWTSRNGKALFIQTCENQSIWETTEGCALPGRILRNISRRAMLAYTVPRIRHTFPISSAGADLLESFGLGGRVTRIPLGVDTRIFRPDPRARLEVRESWDTPEETPVVSYFGRLSRQKGIHILLNALIELAGSDWRLALDDFDPEGSGYLEEIGELLGHPAFDGRLIRIHAKHHEVPRYMNAVDIIVVPSVREGSFLEQYGRVVPEGLACGARVITSDSGALPEVGGGHTGIFPEGSLPGLVKMLGEELQIPNSSRMQAGVAHSAWASANLSQTRQWEIMQPVMSRACAETST